MNRRLTVGLGLAALVSAATVVLAGSPAGAHPLGNLTVNTSTRIVVAPDEVRVDRVLDLAELPTVLERQQMDTSGDGDVDDAEATAYRSSECARIAGGLRVGLGGRVVALSVVSSALRFPPGQAGLATTRLECSLRADATIGAPTAITFSDANRTDRIGWREVIAVGDGTTLATELPTTSPTAMLTAYPTDGRTPPRQLQADIGVRPGGPRLVEGTTRTDAAATRPQARGADGLTQRFNDLVGSRHLTVGLAALAAGLALLLGALHALAPGHGKTLMAAAAVGRGGTAGQVVGIGATVAVTHTAGVLALGSLLWAGQVVAPDQALPWLTALSGVMLVATGLVLLVRRLRGQGGHTHGPGGHTHSFAFAGGDHAHGDPAHPHPHLHDHDDHGHDAHAHGHAHDDHGHDAHAHDHAHPHPHPRDHDDPSHPHPQATVAGRPATAAPGRRSLIAMGVAGGLVPTPSALVVLLGATALGRAWLGVVLVGIYGIGMAATLVGAGYLLVRLQTWLERRFFGRPWWELSLRVAPALAAGLLVAGGILLTARGANAL